MNFEENKEENYFYYRVSGGNLNYLKNQLEFHHLLTLK